ncbi:MAG TPA: NPCBM/NEW2 domain-containing protein [Planctomicrobium sp.]|nr:NPCBM/NEW2 domain-containing protein [Planctomicrobium sp.]
MKPVWPSTFTVLLCCIASAGFSHSVVIAGPQVTVTRLDGSSVTGELTSVSLEQIQLQSEAGPQSIPTGSVMQLDVTNEIVTVDSASVTTISTADQSQLLATSFTSDGTAATLESAGLGALSLPLRQLADVRLAPLDDKVEASWQDLRSRNTRDDLLIIRKQDVLDYASGSVGRISAEAVTMLVRNRELSAPRDRVFGIILASQAKLTGRKIAVRTTSGEVVQVTQLELKEEELQVQSSSLGTVTIALNKVASIDFGGGRLRFLADLPVDTSESQSPDPQEPILWFLSKNSPAGSGGKGVLRIGQKEYKRGLWLHSGAALRYRLNREYTRLRTTAGFELTHVTRMPRFNPKVTLIVSGDGRELYRKEFIWNEPPVPIEVDLTDIRDLSIRVESNGAAKGILEHFALGDAQILQ